MKVALMAAGCHLHRHRHNHHHLHRNRHLKLVCFRQKVKWRELVPSSRLLFLVLSVLQIEMYVGSCSSVVPSPRVAFYCGTTAVTRIHNLHYTCAGVEFNYNFNSCKRTKMHIGTENKMRLQYAD